MTAIVILAASFLAAPSASAKSPALPSKSAVMAMVPSDIVVEQTVSLSDGRTVSLFFKKTGNLCEVYSPDSLEGYEISDLASMEASSFRIVKEAKGKRVYKTTVNGATKLIKRLVNAYL